MEALIHEHCELESYVCSVMLTRPEEPRPRSNTIKAKATVPRPSHNAKA